MALCLSTSDLNVVKTVLKTVESILQEEKNVFVTEKQISIIKTPHEVSDLNSHTTTKNKDNNESVQTDAIHSLEGEDNFCNVSLSCDTIIDCTDADFFQKYGFTEEEIIGVGASAEVLKVVSDSDPSVIRATKVFPFIDENCDSESRKKAFTKEIAILQSIEHRHVLQDFTAYSCLEYGVLEMDYYQEGSLREVFTDRPQQTLDRYFTQIACAVRFMHKQRFVHRDIKLENILIRGGDAVLIDFGCADYLPTSNMLQERVGTPDYMAPEVKCGEEETEYDAFRADSYSLGVVLWALLTGKCPARESRYCRELKQHRINIDTKIYSAAFFLLRCDAFKRFSVGRTLSYLRDQDWHADLIDTL